MNFEDSENFKKHMQKIELIPRQESFHSLSKISLHKEREFEKEIDEEKGSMREYNIEEEIKEPIIVEPKRRLKKK